MILSSVFFIFVKRRFEDYKKELEKDYNRLFISLDQAYRNKESNFELLKLDYDRLKEVIDSFSQEAQNSQKELNNEIEEKKLHLESLLREENEKEYKLKEIQDRIDSALETEKQIAELKRKEQEENADRDYYKLQLSPIALDDVKVFRSIEHLISNKEELNKIIWKLGYEKPFNELCNRIMKNGESNCGIYRIVNMENGKAYVGQSSSIKERLRSHVKSGLGVDSKNTPLYNDMRKGDLSNFTFEVLEYCKPAELNDKERFWIEYTTSNIYGYNQKL